MGLIDRAEAWPCDAKAHNVRVIMGPVEVNRLALLAEVHRRTRGLSGAIVQAGVMWGGDMMVFAALESHVRGRRRRQLWGFDTFEGLCGRTGDDGTGQYVRDGELSTGVEYKDWIESHLWRRCHTRGLPKPMLVQGDVRKTLRGWDRPVSLLYMDMDLYAPTAHVLDVLRPSLQPGAVVVFDEYRDPKYPGEGKAADEWLQTVGHEAESTPYKRQALIVTITGSGE